ncbi:MAG: L,D-transpeptidase family protein [Solirubrobacteraceae bacterium]
MGARPDRGRVAGRRFWGRSHGRLAAGDATDWKPTHPRRARTIPTGVLLMAAVVVAVAVGALLARHHSVGSLLGSGSAGASAPAPPLTPTRLVRLPGQTIANGTEPLSVILSAPAAASSPRPILRPAVAGAWSTVGDAEVFTPAATLAPCSTYTLTVWAHTFATGHAPLGRRHVHTLHVACPPITGLQQALARLGYLGAKLHPRYRVHIPAGTETRGEAAVHAFRPPHGRLAPDPADAPPVEPGQLDETTKSALEVFQSDHDLEPTGEPNAATWAKLIIVESLYHRNPHPYTWVSVTESIPETLEVHRGEEVALSSPTNTGVAGAETAQGIFPIFARYVATTMSGTNPDGSKYKDPGVPWVNYFNGGDAVHGFVRGSYGTPQSDGCVELPVETAAAVYPMLQIGDVVWVT